MKFDLNNFIDKNSSQENMKYELEPLKTENEDFQFILQALTSEKFNSNPKVLHMLKFHCVEKSEEDKLKGRKLLLHGVKSNEAFDILRSGYPDKDLKCECYRREFMKFDCHCYPTSIVSHEISNGISYCKTKGGAVEELSFVVVCAKNFECNFVGDEEIRNQKADSRGCYITGGSFVGKSVAFVESVVQMIPAYLVIFEGDDS